MSLIQSATTPSQSAYRYNNEQSTATAPQTIDEYQTPEYKRIKHIETKFIKALNQIDSIKQRINELLKIFSSDQATLNLAVKKSLQIQIDNLIQIKNAYSYYAHVSAAEMSRLQCELYGADVVRESYAASQQQSSQQ